MPKLIYIAHPVGGNIEENVREILKICREVHNSDVIPVAPYLVAVQYLNDHVTEERRLGIAANIEFFRRRVMDEVWIYGNRISSGMREEIRLSVENEIPIVCRDEALQSELESIVKELKDDVRNKKKK